MADPEKVAQMDAAYAGLRQAVIEDAPWMELVELAKAVVDAAMAARCD